MDSGQYPAQVQPACKQPITPHKHDQVQAVTVQMILREIFEYVELVGCVAEIQMTKKFIYSPAHALDTLCSDINANDFKDNQIKYLGHNWTRQGVVS